jgi:ribulose-phosphate 3-epimerase
MTAQRPQCTLSPSLLNADFTDLKTALAQIEAGGAHYAHLDIMDGHFVPNLTFGPPVVERIRQRTQLPIDCHLMVSNPEFMVPLFAKAGADLLTVHAESTVHLDRLLNRIKELGCKAGVALNPATSISVLEHVLPLCDMVLIMSVNPGFGGQSFIPYTLDKVRALRDWADQVHPSLDIQVDGGIKASNAKEIRAAGCTNFVVGSGIFAAQDPVAATRELVQILA